jgi:hypothetical protein
MKEFVSGSHGHEYEAVFDEDDNILTTSIYLPMQEFLL